MKDCKVFNLRKINEVQTPFNPFGENTTTHSVSFDQYGGYLVTGSGNGICVYGGKTMTDPIHVIPAHEGIVNVAKFTPSGEMIVSGADDRFLKVHSLQ